MRLEFVSAIADIGYDAWQSLCSGDYPFMRYEFLHALEHSRACCEETGWQPQHIVVRDKNNTLLAVAPCYLKHHSYGAYIFDWAWADAYRRHGLAYYPKLLAAIPFTPVTGARVAIREHIDRGAIYRLIVDACQSRCRTEQLSSFHVLYPQQAHSQLWYEEGLLPRASYQYHWFNEGYQDFNHFLDGMKSRKRKAIRKERAAVEAQNIDIQRIKGVNVSPQEWRAFHHFYQLTYAKRSGHGGYLPLTFFERLSDTMAEQLLLIVARREDEIVAASLFFMSHNTLFGRYWGCSCELEFLHFELCYYQGIDFCIEHGLSRFDAGAQGEHKIARGFRPIATCSNHWLADQRFHQAVAQYVAEEAAGVDRYLLEAADQLPFSNAR